MPGARSATTRPMERRCDFRGRTGTGAIRLFAADRGRVDSVELMISCRDQVRSEAPRMSVAPPTAAQEDRYLLLRYLRDSFRSRLRREGTGEDPLHVVVDCVADRRCVSLVEEYLQVVKFH